MLNASSDFLDGLRYSHKILVRASLVDRATGGTLETYDVVSGNFTATSRSNIWRQCNVVLTSPWVERFESLDVTDIIRIERGVRFYNKQEEWITVGEFFVQDISHDVQSRRFTVTGFDAGSAIEDFGLITPYAPQSADGSQITFVQAIQELINAVLPNATLQVGEDVDTTLVTQSSTVFTGSRWDAINQLAKGLGAVVHATIENNFQIEVISEDPAAVWEAGSGQGGVLVTATQGHSRREQFNAVQVRWESPNGGGVVFVVDSDPESPTYWDGPFGRKPAPEESLPEVDSESAAVGAATALLNQYKGFARSLSFTSITNPLLEPLDVVRVTTPDGKADDHIIDNINYSLGGATMSCETRLIRTVTQSDRKELKWR